MRPLPSLMMSSRLSVDDSTLCGYGLNNKQEKIILFDSDGNLVDAIEWGEDYDDVPGSPFVLVSEGNTLARYQGTDVDDTSVDFFECSSPSPGSENIQTIQEEQPEETASEEEESEETPGDVPPPISDYRTVL